MNYHELGFQVGTKNIVRELVNHTALCDSCFLRLRKYTFFFYLLVTYLLAYVCKVTTTQLFLSFYA